MKTSSTAPETFRPKWRGNLELPEEEQIKVTVTHPTVKEYEPFDRGPGRIPAPTAIVERFCTGIEAYEHDGKPVTNGEELCACKAVDVYGLVTEIFLFIWRGVALGEDREKN